jgi:hypothetical protein
MSKKPYDLSKVQNELTGASAFFKKPASPAEPPSEPEQPAPSAAPPIQPLGPSESPSRTPVRSVRPVRPTRRQMIRHPFELYQDQVESLRQLANEDRMHGGTGSMSAMVRAAIDRLIDEQSASSK